MGQKIKDDWIINNRDVFGLKKSVGTILFALQAEVLRQLKENEIKTLSDYLGAEIDVHNKFGFGSYKSIQKVFVEDLALDNFNPSEENKLKLTLILGYLQIVLQKEYKKGNTKNILYFTEYQKQFKTFLGDYLRQNIDTDKQDFIESEEKLNKSLRVELMKPIYNELSIFNEVKETPSIFKKNLLNSLDKRDKFLNKEKASENGLLKNKSESNLDKTIWIYESYVWNCRYNFENEKRIRKLSKELYDKEIFNITHRAIQELKHLALTGNPQFENTANYYFTKCQKILDEHDKNIKENKLNHVQVMPKIRDYFDTMQPLCKFYDELLLLVPKLKERVVLRKPESQSKKRAVKAKEAPHFNTHEKLYEALIFSANETDKKPIAGAYELLKEVWFFIHSDEATFNNESIEKGKRPLYVNPSLAGTPDFEKFFNAEITYNSKQDNILIKEQYFMNDIENWIEDKLNSSGLSVTRKGKLNEFLVFLTGKANTPKTRQKATEKDEALKDIITHIMSQEIVEGIKVQYKNIKGKRLKLLLLAFQELGLIPRERTAKKFHNLCKVEFEWEIASYNAMNGYDYNEYADNEELNSMIGFIESLIQSK